MGNDWFYIYRKKAFGGFVIGFYKIFSVWVVNNEFQITIAKPSYKRLMYWWKKIDVSFSPITVDIYKN